jgi:ABC transporter substrate binding protein (PQQ-dependent alcohol dehydrogenase system)
MALPSTIIRLVALLTVLVAAAGAAAQDQPTLSFAYLYRAADPLYEPHEGYTGLVLRDRHRPLDGAKTAMRESRIIGRALGLSFELTEEEVGDAESAAAAIRRIAEGGTHFFLLDQPAEELEAAGRELATEPGLVLFNIRNREDRLRGEGCSPVLFHTIPSEAMLADALAEFLQSRDWTRVLMLVGPEPDDEARADAFEASARKFSLKIADRRSFVLSNDPRERDRNNIALLTGDARYDVIYLADSLGEFGRYVPYATYLPRPVIGSEGLAAKAWDWTWERNGAPQLNQRFDRVGKRRMADADWAAWAAVRSIVEAIRQAGSVDPTAIRETLRSPELNLDLYKGMPGSFREWDNQLRQPILLATHNAVIATAPLPGFLHQRNTLDSLGRDRPESACSF